MSASLPFLTIETLQACIDTISTTRFTSNTIIINKIVFASFTTHGISFRVIDVFSSMQWWQIHLGYSV